MLWTTPSEPPKALQASECSELLDPMRASCLILAQHQPGKFKPTIWKSVFQAPAMRPKALGTENSAWGSTAREGRGLVGSRPQGYVRVCSGTPTEPRHAFMSSDFLFYVGPKPS